MSDAERHFLRHMIATLAYRAGKAVRGAPDGFGEYRPDGAFNTPLAVLAHVADLIEWACRWCDGDEETFRITEPTTWDGDVARFFDALATLDARLASGPPIAAPLERLFQAPIADALTHVGQIALLRRMAGAPVLGEAYRHAPIEVGRVGPDQGPPGREFALDKGAVWRPSRTR
jgi:hypothetical protein